jgi:hypothetical protein
MSQALRASPTVLKIQVTSVRIQQTEDGRFRIRLFGSDVEFAEPMYVGWLDVLPPLRGYERFDEASDAAWQWADYWHVATYSDVEPEMGCGE